MGHSTSTPSAEGAASSPRDQHGLLFDMEEQVRDMRNLSSALVLMVGGTGKVALEREDIVEAFDFVSYLMHERASTVVRGWEAAFEAGKGAAA